MPISFGTAFGLGWQLEGLWLGVALALGLVAAIEGWFLMRTDWERAVEVCLVSSYAFFSFTFLRRLLTHNYYRPHRIEMQQDDL